MALSCESAKLSEGDRVKSASGDAVRQSERRESTSQLGRRLPRESEREDMGSEGRAVEDTPCDPPGEHACLARAGTCQHAQRACRRSDRLNLLSVTSDEEALGASGA